MEFLVPFTDFLRVSGLIGLMTLASDLTAGLACSFRLSFFRCPRWKLLPSVFP